MKPGQVAFLFLGETLLIPHLWPIVEALAADAPGLIIDCWVSTSVHERLLGQWSADLRNVRLRRAPGFLTLLDLAEGENPPLPAKLPMLARLAPKLLGTQVAVCAEQTSLWIPRLLPFLPMTWVKTSHGVGSMSARDDPRRRAADWLLVPSEKERATYLARGFAPDRVIATGYVKTSFRQHTPARDLFAEDMPIILYAPHWQKHRSSWWRWGREIVAMLSVQQQFNIILAPHQRLIEKEPGVANLLAAAADLPHVHADTRSFAMVDGSYTSMADIYLGDTSSQVVEYLARPRPCVFLNAQGIDWRATDDHDFWACGDVIDDLATLPAALAKAAYRHSSYAAAQRDFASAALGDMSGKAPARIAKIIDRLAKL